MSEFQQVLKDGADTVKGKFKRLMLILLGVGVVLVAGYIWVCGFTYSEGTRAGDLIKISNKGVVFKTYEGQLNLGGFQSDDAGITGNVWDFSTTSDDVYEQLQNMEGKKVKIHYRQRYKPMPWQGKTDYFVYKVEPIQN